MRPPRAILSFLIALTASILACNGEDLSGPTTGALELVIATSGVKPDPDGYTVRIDTRPDRPIASSGSLLSTDLSPGAHTIHILGIADNCALTGENPRTVTLRAGETLKVMLVVGCITTAGTIRITTNTTGSPADPDGYTTILDAGAQTLSLGVNDDVLFREVPLGSHTVQLAGVADYCQVSAVGGTSVTLDGGSARVNFVVACSTTTGGIEVTATTINPALAPDSYTVILDNVDSVPLGLNGSITFAGVAPGSHPVRLAGTGKHCLTSFESTRDPYVRVGATSKLAFEITCDPEWTSVPFPPGFGPTGGLWGRSANDLFVTGLDGTRPAILHYNGQEWTQQFQGYQQLLKSISGAFPTDVFAVGYSSAERPRGGTILRYDGTQWLETAGPEFGGPAPTAPWYETVWASASGNAFAGGRLSRGGGSTQTQLFTRFDGVHWVDLPTQGFGALATVFDISGSSATDVYAIGVHQLCDDCNRSAYFVAHYDGTLWTQFFATPDYVFRGVWVAGPGDVWVAGDDFFSQGTVLHYDGTGWSEILSPVPGANPEGALNDVWGNSTSDVYAVGYGRILHYDGANWTEISRASGSRVSGVVGQALFVLSRDAVLIRDLRDGP